jgi:hypothetical protein
MKSILTGPKPVLCECYTLPKKSGTAWAGRTKELGLESRVKWPRSLWTRNRAKKLDLSSFEWLNGSHIQFRVMFSSIPSIFSSTLKQYGSCFTLSSLIFRIAVLACKTIPCGLYVHVWKPISHQDRPTQIPANVEAVIAMIAQDKDLDKCARSVFIATTQGQLESDPQDCLFLVKSEHGCPLPSFVGVGKVLRMNPRVSCMLSHVLSLRHTQSPHSYQ